MKKETVLGYIRLMRPANLPTAMADILAGATVAGAADLFLSSDTEPVLILKPLLFLVLASICLYAGGVVLNDVFDFELDLKERPERPIPSGKVSLKGAMLFGNLLLFLGVVLSFLVNNKCGIISILLVCSILSYDAWAKHHKLFGPLNMGLCRGLNLLLGMAILGHFEQWWIMVIPVFYIAAITMISRGEVHGNNRSNIALASIIYGLVILMILQLAIFGKHHILQVIPFIVVFAVMIYKPLLKAFKDNSPLNIKGAVKAGVIALIVMDACIAAGFSQWWFSLGMLLLLPLSFVLSKQFAVT
ncbi:UbiA-like protein EboC [Robertkochia solimangrovi]|uniref:UbiA-like protein EboC n=1 Tax=Robertkochia solimangrovi TaxID=2213046 RepID=UPI001180A715|nr:UbiA-like protein EboC [Robertkochia solimangrovi]TRZ42888.1 ubiquinone biosynthesis protein UbiA [Robertkochia solimangrovi]